MIRLLLIAVLLSGCASPPKPVEPQAPDQPGTRPAASLKELTHADLQAAAAYAEKNGYPARAAKWRALETLLTASEGLVAACKAAIASDLQKPLETHPGPLTLLEVAAERVAQGISPSVRANCEPIPLPVHLLPVPRLP